MSEELRIRPLIEEHQTEHPLQHKHLPDPAKKFRALIVGASHSGKSLMVLNMLQREDFGYRDWFQDEIFIVSPTIGLDSTWNQIDLPKYHKMDSWKDSTMNQLLKYSVKQPRGILLVLDDLAASDCTNAHKDQMLSKIMMTGRHYGVSLFLMTQKYNSVSTRVRANASHVMTFALPTTSEMKLFLSDNSDVPNVERCYQTATSVPYGFMYIDRSTGGRKKAYQCFERELVFDGADGGADGGAEHNYEDSRDDEAHGAASQTAPTTDGDTKGGIPLTEGEAREIALQEAIA